MKTGAAFGDGIYLAQDLKVAHSFTKGSIKGWSKSIFSVIAPCGNSKGDRGSSSSSGSDAKQKKVVNCSCVVACEVIDHPDNVLKHDERDGTGDEAYYVVADDKHVRNKFLLLYQDEQRDSSFTLGGLQWALGLIALLVALAMGLQAI